MLELKYRPLLPPIAMQVSSLSWLGNVLSSVSIVFANKHLMSTRGFHFATSLTALHFACCSLVLKFRKRGSKVGIPLRKLAFFTLIANTSIVTLNLSLLFNTVSVYQISKLLIVPCCAVLEWIVLGSVITQKSFIAMFLVILGVATVVLEDLNIEFAYAGACIAGVSVITSALQQILVRQLQRDHNISAVELLNATAESQAFTLLMIAPFIDQFASGEWVFEYHWRLGNVVALGLSCLLAVSVNLSQYMCLGQFSALTFQVLSHAKTLLILLYTWAFLHEKLTTIKFCGALAAVLGMVLYAPPSR